MLKKTIILSLALSSNMFASALSDHFSNFLSTLTHKGDVSVKYSKLLCNSKLNTCSLFDGSIILRQSVFLPTSTSTPYQYEFKFKKLNISDISNLIKVVKSKNNLSALTTNLLFTDISLDGVPIDRFFFDPKKYIHTEYITQEEYAVAGELFPKKPNLQLSITQKPDKLKGVITTIDTSLTSNEFEVNLNASTWSRYSLLKSPTKYLNSLEISSIKLLAAAPKEYFKYITFLDYLENAKEAASLKSLKTFHNIYLLPVSETPLSFEIFDKSNTTYFALKRNTKFFERKKLSSPFIQSISTPLKTKIDELLINTSKTIVITAEAIEEDSTQALMKIIAQSAKDNSINFDISDYFLINIK